MSVASRAARILCAASSVVFAAASSAAFDEDEAAKRHVGVRVYDGRVLERVATGIVVAPGVVLADAETLAQGRHHVVVASGGAEMAARVTHADRAMSLAVLEVSGLDVPVVPFAHKEVAVDEDRFVHAVAFVPATSDPASSFAFRVGSIGRADDVVARRGGTPVSVYEHNARLAAAGFGGSLLNNCGQLVGINRPDPEAGGLFGDALRDPSGIVFASRLEAVEKRLDEWAVEYTKSDTECASEATLAAATAAQKAEEAERARLELEEARRREQELTDAAAAAREADDASRAEAEAAQREATAAVEEAEARQKAATEEMEAAQQRAAAESARLEEALSDATAERERLQTESRTVMAIATVSVLLFAIIIVVLLARSRQKNRVIAETAARTVAAEQELEAAHGGDFPDCLLEGADDQGVRFGLKIPGSALRAGVEGVTIGRSPDRADFVLDHPSISRAHCRLHWNEGDLHVEDLRATNGVTVNGDMLASATSRPLHDGDTLTLGAVQLALRFL